MVHLHEKGDELCWRMASIKTGEEGCKEALELVLLAQFTALDF